MEIRFYKVVVEVTVEWREPERERTRTKVCLCVCFMRV
jgi:hypothetical protein